jgi:hypothetical protein
MKRVDGGESNTKRGVESLSAGNNGRKGRGGRK